MDLINRAPQIRTSITVDKSDFDYSKKHGLKFSHMVRAFVRDHRVHTDDPDAEPTIRELQRKMEFFKDKMQAQLKWLERKGLIDEYYGQTKEL